MREESTVAEHRDEALLIRAVPSDADVYQAFVEFFCGDRPIMLKDKLEDLEKKIILYILEKTQGNQREAARLLGIKYTTLFEKIKKHGIRCHKQMVVFPLSL